MLVIYRAGDWQLIESPQDPAEAWDFCALLETQTGIRHYVGKV